MKQKQIFLSVIIPVYNEKDRLSNIKKIRDYLKSKPFTSEILLVNDGSDAEYEKELQRIKKKYKDIKLLAYALNRGKGYAIQQGMLQARGKYRLFTDVDLSVPIESFDNFIPFLKKHKAILASRNLQGSYVEKRQNFIRQNMGKMFTFLSQQLLQLPVSDFTCGFKCFSSDAARAIFSKTKIQRWGFDSEVLFICNKMKYPIKEVAVMWKNDNRSKVKFPRDIILSFLELLMIIRNNAMGLYNK